MIQSLKLWRRRMAGIRTRVWTSSASRSRSAEPCPADQVLLLGLGPKFTSPRAESPSFGGVLDRCQRGILAGSAVGCARTATRAAGFGRRTGSDGRRRPGRASFETVGCIARRAGPAAAWPAWVSGVSCRSLPCVCPGQVRPVSCDGLIWPGGRRLRLLDRPGNGGVRQLFSPACGCASVIPREAK